MSAPTTNQDLDRSALRKAFGVFPSGVVAVAAVVDGKPVGLAASSFTSVSLEPALVSLSIASTSKTWPDLRRATHLRLTVLAENHAGLCRQLAGPVGDRFDGIALSVSGDGALTLQEGLARCDCTIFREVEAGDHTRVLLRLHAVQHSAGQPLILHRSVFGRLAE